MIGIWPYTSHFETQGTKGAAGRVSSQLVPPTSLYLVPPRLGASGLFTAYQEIPGFGILGEMPANQRDFPRRMRLEPPAVASPKHGDPHAPPPQE
jgi:hypothetical protein